VQNGCSSSVVLSIVAMSTQMKFHSTRRFVTTDSCILIIILSTLISCHLISSLLILSELSVTELTDAWLVCNFFL